MYSYEPLINSYEEPRADYFVRHNVLFNLFGFDPIFSMNVQSPTLNLVDCDFKFFFNKSALIQVETNHFVEMGLEFTYEQYDEFEDSIFYRAVLDTSTAAD